MFELARHMTTHSQQFFTNQDFTSTPLPASEFEGATFTSCNFSGIDLGNMVFAECTFKDCNFSMARIVNTAFRQVTFSGCKLMGLSFDRANNFLFEITVSDSLLDHSSFHGRKMKQTVFRKTSLQGVDFSSADLTNAVLDECDLTSAVFADTTLTGCDLRTAFNFSIDPERNKMKKARFSSTGLEGLLHKYELDVS